MDGLTVFGSVVDGLIMDELAMNRLTVHGFAVDELTMHWTAVQEVEVERPFGLADMVLCCMCRERFAFGLLAF